MSALKGPCPFQFKLAFQIQKTRQMNDCSIDMSASVECHCWNAVEQISCSFFETDAFCLCQIYWQTHKHTHKYTLTPIHLWRVPKQHSCLQIWKIAREAGHSIILGNPNRWCYVEPDKEWMAVKFSGSLHRSGNDFCEKIAYSCWAQWVRFRAMWNLHLPFS